MGHILFYATAGDLLPILKLVEDQVQLKYTRFGTIASSSPDAYLSALDIRNLGIASKESSINCDTYLIGSRETKIRAEQPIIINGKLRYAFNQLYNPETVTLTPGGWWKENILLHGRVATASKHPSSLKLMKLYANAFRKQFIKIKSFYMGPRPKSLWIKEID